MKPEFYLVAIIAQASLCDLSPTVPRLDVGGCFAVRCSEISPGLTDWKTVYYLCLANHQQWDPGQVTQPQRTLAFLFGKITIETDDAFQQFCESRRTDSCCRG